MTALRTLFLTTLSTSFLLLQGCALYDRHGLPPAKASELQQTEFNPSPTFPADIREKILRLDPEHVSAEDIHGLLSKLPAPRIINIHGGIYPVHRRMISFSEFLVGMGYPESQVKHAVDGTYTFSCYESSRLIAGMTAWYYEQEGLRPMLVGHSQGGMQVVKVLQLLASSHTNAVHVWNPLTWEREDRTTILDPLTHQARPVAGLHLPYATSMGAGGLTRILPNQWDMCFRLRSIPDSVEEFTGFYKHNDLLGGDFLGYGSMNEFKANGHAAVRNIRLPTDYKHGAVPDTRHLLDSPSIKEWLNRYHPTQNPLPPYTLQGDTTHLLWAQDVWFSIKKHWVLELQTLVRAQSKPPGQHP